MNLYLYPFLAYLSGSIPYGLIFSELFGVGGLRRKGSGNIGSTNVLRTQGKLLGALTLVFDFFKAFLPCYFLQTDDALCNVLVLLAPTFGHIFPIWLKFRGGKGVASFLGTLAAIHWQLLAGTGLIWLGVFAFCRISSVACLISTACSIELYRRFFNDGSETIGALIVLACLIFWRHKDNIARLMQNKENKF